MKKNLKAALAVLSAGLMLGAIVGCSDPAGDDPKPETPTTKYGEGYGMVHGAGYIGRAVIGLDGDTVTYLYWDEACLPTYVQAGEDVPAADKVATKVMSHGSEVDATYYKTVKFGKVTMTYDTAKNTYVVDGMTMTEWFQTEANCKAYYDAVVYGNVAVVVNGKEDTKVLSPKALLKTHNSYWDTATVSGLGYRVNYKKTVDYIMANGLKAAATLEKDGTWIDENNVNSGATWTDLNTKKDNTLSYVQLCQLAANNATESKWAFGYGMVHGAGYIGRALAVVDADGKLTDLSWDEACLPTYVVAGEGVAAADKVTVTVTDHGKQVEKSFYKTVKFDGVTMTYDAAKTTYVVDGKTMVEWFQTEANAAKYYEAVAEDKVAVVVGGKEDTSVLTAKALLKSRNQYWNTATVSGQGYWLNYGKTVEYILANGLKAAATLEKDGTWVDENNVNSGATWTDLNTKKDNTLSYVALAQLAFDNIK